MSSSSISLLLSSITEDQHRSFLFEYAKSHEKFVSDLSKRITERYDDEVADCFYYPKISCDLEQIDKAVTRMMARAYSFIRKMFLGIVLLYSFVFWKTYCFAF